MNSAGVTKDELLERFDAGEEVLDLFNLEEVERPNREFTEAQAVATRGRTACIAAIAWNRDASSGEQL